jgi:hypothetical protein
MDDPEEEFVANRWGSICPQDSLISYRNKGSGEGSQLLALLDNPNSELNRSQFGILEDDIQAKAANPMAMGKEACLDLHINTPFIPEGEPDPAELLPVVCIRRQ